MFYQLSTPDPSPPDTAKQKDRSTVLSLKHKPTGMGTQLHRPSFITTGGSTDLSKASSHGSVVRGAGGEGHGAAILTRVLGTEAWLL